MEDFQGDRLSVDVTVLALLLKRGRSQHRRCIYYRRLSMVLSALRKLPSAGDISDWTARHGRLVRLLADEGGQERTKEDRWTLDRDGDGPPAVVSAADDELSRRVRELVAVRARLSTLVCESLPRVLSRILHAAPAVLHEISRGYFLPFMTVALACAARVRTMLMRLGRDAVAALGESAPTLLGLAGRGGAYGELAGAVGPGDVPGGDGSRPPGGWDGLAAAYAEVTDGGLTRRLHEFTRRRRREHAAARLGGAIPSEDRTDGGDSERQPDELPVESLGSPGGNGREPYDAGEVVDVGSRPADPSRGAVVQREVRRSADVDDNMARVLQGRRGKEKTKEAGRTNAKPTSKKKRAKTSSSPVEGRPAAPSPGSDTEDIGEKKSKRKQKTKKKKKKRKTNVIDDIFA